MPQIPLPPGAGRRIHQAVLDLAAAGAAVLIVSQDLDELLTLTRRIGVLYDGRLSRLWPTASVDRATLGLAMSGADAGVPEAVP